MIFKKLVYHGQVLSSQNIDTRVIGRKRLDLNILILISILKQFMKYKHIIYNERVLKRTLKKISSALDSHVGDLTQRDARQEEI